MDFMIIRTFFFLVSLLMGFQLGSMVMYQGHPASIAGMLFGGGLAVALIFSESAVRRVSVRGLSAAVFGLLFGLLMAKLLSDALGLVPMDEGTRAAIRLVLTLIFCYLGMVMAMRGRDEFHVIIPYVRLSRQDQSQDMVLLDTSVIIDGRIDDICQTKFIEGRLIVPRFILRELQRIADASDPMKRNRGRRGLEILNRLQKSPSLDIHIHEDDVASVAEVDGKLVKLAKILGAKILTNDYNLNKVAEIQNVTVLNINDLASALRPVVLPGEKLELKPIKEGKEYNQGVAYLDDGTMVVVENGKLLIGQTITSVVTSVLQTSAGRMIFARPEGEVSNGGGTH